MAQWTTHLRVRRSFYVTALGGKLIRDPGDLRGVRGVPRRAVGDGLGIPVNMEQSTPEWYVLIRAPRCHFPVENPHCLGFLETRTVRPGVPFTVDPPSGTFVIRASAGGGARAGARTSLGRVVVPRVYRVFAGLPNSIIDNSYAILTVFRGR